MLIVDAIRLFLGRRCWLVPGGVVVAEHRSWRKRGRFMYIRREESPLIIDCADVGAFSYGRYGSAAVQLGVGPALLAAWLSEARAPTVDEVRSFLGGDVDVHDRR